MPDRKPTRRRRASAVSQSTKTQGADQNSAATAPKKAAAKPSTNESIRIERLAQRKGGSVGICAAKMGRAPAFHIAKLNASMAEDRQGFIDACLKRRPNLDRAQVQEAMDELAVLLSTQTQNLPQNSVEGPTTRGQGRSPTNSTARRYCLTPAERAICDAAMQRRNEAIAQKHDLRRREIEALERIAESLELIGGAR